VPQGASLEKHLDPLDTARYIAGDVSPADRRRIEEHLARCAECVSEVAAVSRTHRGASHTRRGALAGLAAAAAVALAVGIFNRPKDAGTPDDIRGPTAPAVAAVAVVAPAQGELLARSGSFRWRAIAGAITYRLSVSDPQGNQIWSVTTSDTSVARPAEVRFQPEQDYFWYVDALLPDGSSNTSGVHRFRVSR